MTEIHNLRIQAKDTAGKGAARATRRAGRVPGVVYGAKQDPMMITMDPRELKRALSTGSFFATLCDLELDGAKQRVLPRDLQLHPVSDQPTHVDFLRVSADTEVNVDVPVIFANQENVVGIKRGGLLNIVRHEIEVICKADAIPQEFRIDLAALELDIGDSVHASNLDLPPGVRLMIADRDFTIATIAAPTVVREEEEAAAAEAEAEGEAEEGAEAEGAEEGETKEADED